ncbi:isochorismate synthase [Kineococcus sp. SYSU DK001]|uniref:isochorismate synthase n=1 Tax=Kineococcus sp. SYSU DK001 TaxID=3383122 RepID=UPI003D7DBCBC
MPGHPDTNPDTNPEPDLVFLGRRRLRGRGRRAVLAPARSTGPGAARAALDLLREVEAVDGVPRVLMGSIPFDPAAPAHLVVPGTVLEVGAEEAGPGEVPQPRSAHPVEPLDALDAPDDPGYRRAVARAVAAIGDGTLQKVVLARSADLRADAPIDTGALLAAFTAGNPAAYAFHVPLRDGAVLVGASPELVAEVAAGVVRSHPLAGTAARQPDPARDDRARTDLLASAKDRAEHAFLVEALAAGLRPLTSALHVPAGPSVLGTPRLWHLGTPLTGTLRPGTSALDVACAVHPTPAVGGLPAAAAARFLAEVEPGDRGTYAGLVGWMDSAGDGEWALALRCAAVRGDRARVHAGAGVVAGSDPAAEHAETAAKMRTALSALAAVAPGLRLRHERELVTS